MKLYTHLQNDNMFIEQGGVIKEITFAGLPDTCELIKRKTDNKVLVFIGNESPIESLRMYNVPDEILNPKNLWVDLETYESVANQLAKEFNKNFEKYIDMPEHIKNAGPKVK